tara:strand:+ start:95 stop:556 length:462 start_codon:yes stop_codon:yes gene_type:complete
MNLTENFSLLELTKSQTAERRGILNKPNKLQEQNLKLIAEKILQPVRDHYEIPFTPSSGFRSPELCIAIGSDPLKSQHCCKEKDVAAVDFEVPGIPNIDLCYFINENLDFDQLILECYTGGNTGWVHCSISPDPRKQLLTYDRTNGYRKGLIT